MNNLRIFLSLGPDTWGEDYPMCGTGAKQSPIDLVNPVEGEYGPLEFSAGYFRDRNGTLVNNGHSGKFI